MSAISIASDFIKAREQCRLIAYRDSGGVWTIGWGHVGPEVIEGLVWSQVQADQQFATDLISKANGVDQLTKRLLSDKQKAALYSFAFNVGLENLATSTLLKLISDCDFIGAAKAWVAWDHVGATEVRGLLIRRLDEASLFLQGSP